MAKKCVLDILVTLLLFNCILLAVNGHSLPPKIFDVVKYGAVSDAKTDNTKAFLKAWDEACGYSGRSRVFIPNGIFLLDSVSFVGPCSGSISFLVKGTIRAPTDSRRFFTDTWIGFRYVSHLTVKGGGILDGQGQAAWPFNDCKTNDQCKPLPTTLRFDFVNNSRVLNLHSINSKSSHVNIFACGNFNITNVRLTAPSDSPNTDGIHIGSSSQIKITHVRISTGDDCISMVSGSQNIEIYDVSCGPGHGISIGSLGRSHEHEYVKGITVRNCSFIGSDNGVRIKTWSPSLYSEASDMTFQDIFMQNPKNPIVIDQQYCPSSHCLMKSESRSAVQIKDVTFSNIWGISSTKVALDLQCSGTLPCQNVKLIDINLSYNGPGGQAISQCSNVIGSSHGKLVPSGCL
ncbi:hypothetical protein ACP275_08G211300 [Erythranthe tilingii]